MVREREKNRIKISSLYPTSIHYSVYLQVKLSVSSLTFFPHHFCPVSPSPVLPSLGMTFLHLSDRHTFILPRCNPRDERPHCETSNFHTCTFFRGFNYRCMHRAFGRQKFWTRKANMQRNLRDAYVTFYL